jgi:hypothetical protein
LCEVEVDDRGGDQVDAGGEVDHAKCGGGAGAALPTASLCGDCGVDCCCVVCDAVTYAMSVVSCMLSDIKIPFAP